MEAGIDLATTEAWQRVFSAQGLARSGSLAAGREVIDSRGDASAAIFRLRPVTFRYIQPYADGSRPRDYGLIAEEVDEVFPDLVVRNAAGEIETVQYHKLVPMLLNELQRLRQEVDELRGSEAGSVSTLQELLERASEASDAPHTHAVGKGAGPAAAASVVSKLTAAATAMAAGAASSSSPPTVSGFACVPRDARVACREVFGPVCTLAPFERFDEALAEVDASDFGLQAGVFTPRLEHALRAHEELEVGGVVVNDVPTSRVDAMPYGGVKGSGQGREGLRSAMREMTEPRVLLLRRGDGRA